MTSKAPAWDPYDIGFSEQEDAMTDFSGEVIISKTTARGRRIINFLSTIEDYAVDFTNDENFHKGLNDKVNVANIGESKVSHGVNLGYLCHK